ncbi:hypothetical protein OEZ86_003219 [Tetradesmus obliquus]|nr:hypothetical protein OEZ86_003219 [Tetradesmus obliquus]
MYGTTERSITTTQAAIFHSPLVKFIHKAYEHAATAISEKVSLQIELLFGRREVVWKARRLKGQRASSELLQTQLLPAQ